jgi:hypothetical protein
MDVDRKERRNYESQNEDWVNDVSRLSSLKGPRYPEPIENHWRWHKTREN